MIPTHDRAMQLYEDELASSSLDDGDIWPVATPPQRTTILPEDTSTAKECQICFDAKHTDLFPQINETSNCRCLSDACLVCIQQHIKSQMNSKEWKEGSITCPMCNRALIYQEIQNFADSETFAT